MSFFAFIMAIVTAEGLVKGILEVGLYAIVDLYMMGLVENRMPYELNRLG